MKNEEQVIICPVCGQEFLPAEIFMPKEFLGEPKNIHKTADGKVDFYLGNNMDTEETYYCDNCGAKLKINANVSFDVQVEEEGFEEEYETSITRQKKVKLSEQELF